MAKSNQRDDQVARQLTTWLAQENITPERRPTSGELAFQLDFGFPSGPTPAAKVITARQKGRDSTGLIVVVRLDPTHQGRIQNLLPNKRDELYAQVRRVALQGGVVGFGPHIENGVIVGWQLDVTVYDDGLTQHNVMTGIRQLVSKHLEIIDELNLRLGVRPANTSSQQDLMFI